MHERADVVKSLGFDGGEGRLAVPRFDPDEAVDFAGLIAGNASVEFGRRRTFALTVGRKRPAVIAAAQALADDFPSTELETPVGADVGQGAHLPASSAE